MRGRRPCVRDTGAPAEPATLTVGREEFSAGAARSPGTPLPAAERRPSGIYNRAEPRAGRTGDHDARRPPPGDARRDRRRTHPAVSLAFQQCPARRRAASAGPCMPQRGDRSARHWIDGSTGCPRCASASRLGGIGPWSRAGVVACARTPRPASGQRATPPATLKDRLLLLRGSNSVRKQPLSQAVRGPVAVPRSNSSRASQVVEQVIDVFVRVRGDPAFGFGYAASGPTYALVDCVR